MFLFKIRQAVSSVSVYCRPNYNGLLQYASSLLIPINLPDIVSSVMHLMLLTHCVLH